MGGRCGRPRGASAIWFCRGESFADLELGVSHVVLENDRSVHDGAFVAAPGIGVGQDRFEITLKLEPAGWRVATFKYGKNIIEF
jgi:hypothetical protein